MPHFLVGGTPYFFNIFEHFRTHRIWVSNDSSRSFDTHIIMILKCSKNWKNRGYPLLKNRAKILKFQRIQHQSVIYSSSPFVWHPYCRGSKMFTNFEKIRGTPSKKIFQKRWGQKIPKIIFIDFITLRIVDHIPKCSPKTGLPFFTDLESAIRISIFP